jgi:hydrogenase maturation protease
VTGAQAPAVLVLGIGNVLWADEGFGVRCVEQLDELWDLGPGARAVDGGTQGLYLVSLVTDSRRILVFDAVDFGDAPGTVRIVRGAEVPACMGANNLSLHQVGFQDVLAAAELLGSAPESITLVGVQPLTLDDYGGGLTEVVAGRVDEAIERALAELRSWGLSPSRRERQGEPLLADGIRRDPYEGGRPSAEDACRVGDPRCLPPTGVG